MRIGVSGTHGTGKTTLVEALCDRLPGHAPIAEPYFLLEEEGYAFAHPPAVEDYWAQFEHGTQVLQQPLPRAVFDRTPLDALAYLVALGADIGGADVAALRGILASLDLLVVVPITSETERALPRPALRRLRAAMDDALQDLVEDDPLDLCRDVRTIILRGPLEGRVTAILAALSPADADR